MFQQTRLSLIKNQEKESTRLGLLKKLLNQKVNIESILEILFSEVNTFADIYNTIRKQQYGFEVNYSTSHVIEDVINFITSGLDKSNFTMAIFIILRKLITI